jgi:hypothetical protein
MLSHPFFDVHHFSTTKAFVTEYDFSQYSSGPQLSGVVSGSGSGPVVPFTETLGPALKLTMGANPGAATYTGPVINGSKVAGAIIDLEDISYLGSAPLWGVGFYNSALTSYVELFRDNSGVALTSQVGSSTSREIQRTAQNDTSLIRYANAGLFIDFSQGTSIGHIGYSQVQTTTFQPNNVDMNFKIRSLTTAAYQNFSVYIRRIRLTLIP